MKFLLLLLEKITPDLRQLLIGMVAKLEEKAKQTPNPYDDIFVYFLKKVLSID